jgi:hypothetical protein
VVHTRHKEKQMAHFAKIGLNNIVTEILVVANRETMDSNGVEQESIGVEFLRNLTGHETWIQTSYNGNIRKNYAGIGYTYDSQRDAFIPPQPYPSWNLNEETCRWDAPVAMPTDGKMYQWDEATTNWIEVT